jgi:hypothetical protein
MKAWQNPMIEQRHALPGGSSPAWRGILVGCREGIATPVRWRT